jgi:tRNA nucleotidyltransferase (CCA-adding enzyme)
LNAHRAFELKPATVLKLLGALDALRRPARLETFLAACTADKRGRLGHENDDYPQAAYLREACAAAAAVTAGPFVAEGLTGVAIGAAMDAARIHAIAALQANHSADASPV